jgi:hypothetical protein
VKLDSWQMEQQQKTELVADAKKFSQATMERKHIDWNFSLL